MCRTLVREETFHSILTFGSSWDHHLVILYIRNISLSNCSQLISQFLPFDFDLRERLGSPLGNPRHSQPFYFEMSQPISQYLPFDFDLRERLGSPLGNPIHSQPFYFRNVLNFYRKTFHSILTFGSSWDQHLVILYIRNHSISEMFSTCIAIPSIRF